MRFKTRSRRSQLKQCLTTAANFEFKICKSSQLAAGCLSSSRRFLPELVNHQRQKGPASWPYSNTRGVWVGRSARSPMEGTEMVTFAAFRIVENTFLFAFALYLLVPFAFAIWGYFRYPDVAFSSTSVLCTFGIFVGVPILLWIGAGFDGWG